MSTVTFQNVLDFTRYMKKLPDKIINQGKKDLWDMTIKYRNTVLKAMRNTPRIAGREYKRGGKMHNPSAPGNPPAIDSGNLVAMITIQRTNEGGRFDSGAPYAGYLEMGTKYMAARPVYNPTLADMEDEIYRKVFKGMQRAFAL